MMRVSAAGLVQLCVSFCIMFVIGIGIVHLCMYAAVIGLSVVRCSTHLEVASALLELHNADFVWSVIACF